MDISELIIQIKNTDQSVNEIKKVTNALKETGQTASTVGKTLFAGWTFSKVIQGAKLLGDAFKDVLVTFKNFDLLYGKMNKEANASVQILRTSFQETERSAKKLLSLSGSRTIEFNFDKRTFNQLNRELTTAAEELAAFSQLDPSETLDKLTRALYGQTKGLQQYGIVIDQTSEAFKKEVEQMKLINGETEEGAKALVIWSQLQTQLKKFEGSAKNQQLTLTSAINNITNTLKSGAFAKAGQILSKIFVPILNKINDILDKPWTSNITGIVIALGGVLVAFKSITVTLKGLQLLLATFKISSFGGSALSSISPTISGILTKLIVKVSTALTGAVAAVAAAIGVWPAALTAAVVGVLILAGTMIVNKLATGSWFDFNGMARAVLGWFEKLGKKISNALATGKFMTNQEIAKDTIKRFENLRKSYQDSFKDLNDGFQEFSKSMRTDDLSYVSKAEKEALDKLKAAYDRNLKEYNESQETIIRLIADANRKVEEMNKMEKKYGEAWENAYQAYQASLDEQVNFAQNSERLAQEGAVLASKVQNAYQALLARNEQIKLQREQEARLVLEQAKFMNITKMNWIDFTISLKEMVGKISKEDKIKAIKDKIKLIDEALQFSGLDIKEKINFEMQRAELLKSITQLEIDSLNKEYDIVKNTNDMIMEYAKEALRFKEQGVSGIQTGTMEAYKFMTSSFMNTSELTKALGINEKNSLKLDEKRNQILSTTSAEVKNIATRLSNYGFTVNAYSL